MTMKSTESRSKKNTNIQKKEKTVASCCSSQVVTRKEWGWMVDGGWWDAVSPASSLTSIIAVEINIKHKDRI
eukprot:scaffold2395_cov283-Chaetoceros_neogracile.AAC.5